MWSAAVPELIQSKMIATRDSINALGMVRIFTYALTLTCGGWFLWYLYTDNMVLAPPTAVYFIILLFSSKYFSEVSLVNVLVLLINISTFHTALTSGAPSINSLKGYSGFMPLVAVFFLRDFRYFTLWFLCALVYIIALYSVSCSAVSPRPEYDIPLNLSYDITFCFTFCMLTLLYERTRLGAEKARSNLVASVSHELRTPLNGIVCAAELLLERGSLEEEDAQDVGTIFGCGQLMSSLINNVLDAESFNSKRRYSGIDKDMVTDIDEVLKTTNVC
tara:strand:+ start:201 stop:1028 length:828 start_codon:yes stop_codon:yes gene_type:complete